MIKNLLLILFLASFVPTILTLNCIDQNGKEVDWWVTFVYPKNTRQYAYADANNPTLSQASNTLSQGESSAVNYTLSQLYVPSKNGVSQTYAMFNDEIPEVEFLRKREAYVNKAHAKGVVAFDNEGNGFWLLHSIPKFPLSPRDTDVFQYQPDGETKYGQTMFCATFDSLDTFNTIGTQLQYYRPLFYDVNATSTLETIAPNFYNAAVGLAYIHSADNSVQTLKTKGGVDITSFAKTGYYGSGNFDLYDALIAPTLKKDLKVETWRQGSGNPLPSNCTASYKVYNIENLDFFGTSWHYTNDHSKYGVSTTDNYVCMCGINRMGSQGSRGGGGLCFSNSALHSSVTDKISSYETC